MGGRIFATVNCFEYLDLTGRIGKSCNRRQNPRRDESDAPNPVDDSQNMQNTGDDDIVDGRRQLCNSPFNENAVIKRMIKFLFLCVPIRFLI